MGGKHSRVKGHGFERVVAIEFRKIFPKARRQLEYHLDDCQGVDLANTGRYRVQCKKLKKYAPITCIQEVKYSDELGEVPILVTAGDGEPAMAVLPLKDLLWLIESFEKN